MGFSVTASHAIFLVALLGVGSFATTLYWSSQEDVDEARRVQSQRLEELAHTNLTVTGSSYNATAETYTVEAHNQGSTTLRVSELHYLVDGELVASVASTAVDGIATTDLWLPGETLVVVLQGVAVSPTYFQLVAGNGATVSHTE